MMPLAPLPMMSVPAKPKIGFSIDSIVGGTGIQNSRIQYPINNKINDKSDRTYEKTILTDIKLDGYKNQNKGRSRSATPERDDDDETINPGSPASDISVRSSNRYENRSPTDLRYNGNRSPNPSPTNLIKSPMYRPNSPYRNDIKQSPYNERRSPNRYRKSVSPQRSNEQDVSKFDNSLHSNSPRSSISPGSVERTSLSPKNTLIRPSVLPPGSGVPFGGDVSAALKGIYLPEPMVHGVTHPGHHHHPHPLALAAAAQHFQGL